MVAIPFGPILSFANLTFDASRTSEPISYKLEWLTSYAPSAGPYPIDLRGLSDAPKKNPQGTWKYLITAAPGLSGPEAYASVQQGLADIVSALETPYGYTGSYVSGGATVSGQVGDLVVLGADQSTTYTCFARLEMLDVAVKAGHPYALEVPLQFTFLTAWAGAG